MIPHTRSSTFLSTGRQHKGLTVRKNKQDADPMKEDAIKSLRLSIRAIRLATPKGNPGPYKESIKDVENAISKLKKEK